MAIHCCKGCTQPKRHPGCHGSCSEYLAEKAEHERQKEIHDKQRDIVYGIISDRENKIYRAMKNRKGWL